MVAPRDRARSRRVRLLGTLVAIASVSLLIRLWALGDRVAHWDEARIAFWVLQYGATGEWTYHPVFHGPLLFHVERWLFSALGASDYVMRLPTAIVGGLLPLAAWLFRDHLDDTEVLAMAGLLAANPILVYYSRFMRNDILVAAFALVALGLGLRWVGTHRLRYAVGVGLFLGAALGSKENALLYLLAWLGAVLLLLSFRAFSRTRVQADATTNTRNSELWVDAIRGEPVHIGRFAIHGVAAVLVSLVVSLWIYAPRGEGPGSFGSLANGWGAFPAVFEAAIVQPPSKAISFWALGSAQGEYPYLVFFGLLLGILLVGATATLVLAGVGLRRDRKRPLVAFALLWAGLSIVGYPAAADLMAGWTVLHVVVPLTIPAAVGFASLVEEGKKKKGEASRLQQARRPVFAMLAVYLVLTVGVTSFLAPGSTYNPVGQPSQMEDGAGETIAAMQSQLETGGSVAYIGPYWEPLIHRLPLLWYVERAGAGRVFVDSVAGLDDDPPGVLVSHANRSTVIHEAFPTYDCRSHERVPWEGGDPEGLPGEMLICIDD